MTDRLLTEHVEPETDANRVRPARPHANPDVANFLRLKHEQEKTERNREARSVAGGRGEGREGRERRRGGRERERRFGMVEPAVVLWTESVAI